MCRWVCSFESGASYTCDRKRSLRYQQTFFHHHLHLFEDRRVARLFAARGVMDLANRARSQAPKNAENGQFSLEWEGDFQWMAQLVVS